MAIRAVSSNALAIIFTTTLNTQKMSNPIKISIGNIPMREEAKLIKLPNPLE